MSRHRVTVVLSQAQGKHPARRTWKNRSSPPCSWSRDSTCR